MRPFCQKIFLILTGATCRCRGAHLYAQADSLQAAQGASLLHCCQGSMCACCSRLLTAESTCISKHAPRVCCEKAPEQRCRAATSAPSAAERSAISEQSQLPPHRPTSPTPGSLPRMLRTRSRSACPLPEGSSALKASTMWSCPWTQ